MNLFPPAIPQAGAFIGQLLAAAEGYLSLLGPIQYPWNHFKLKKSNRHQISEILKIWNSIEQIQLKDEIAYRILHVLAYLDNRSIPHELILTIGRYTHTNQLPEDSYVLSAITHLKKLSFLKILSVQGNETSYEMNVLVQEATRYKLGLQAMHYRSAGEFPRRGAVMHAERSDLAYYSGIALQVISKVFPSSNRKTWGRCEMYLTHAIKVGDWAETCGNYIGPSLLLNRVSKYLYDRGRWSEKELVDQKALELIQKGLGRNHPDAIRSLGNLAVTYHEQGRYDKAEFLNKKVLKLQRDILGKTHPDTIRSMANLAVTHHKQGQYNNAAAVGEYTLGLRREILGKKHPDTIRSMANLAVTYHEQGRYEKAEILKREALTLQRKLLGEHHSDTIRSMANLAATYDEQGRYDKAEILELEALELMREVLGEKHPDTIHLMANLSVIYHKQGRYDEDKEMSIKVLELYREVLGDNHPDTLLFMQNFAATLSSRGRYDSALFLTQECLQRRRSVLGESHPLTQRSRQLLRKWESRRQALRALT